MLNADQAQYLINMFDQRTATIQKQLLVVEDIGAIRKLQGEALGIAFAKNTIQRMMSLTGDGKGEGEQ